MNLKSAYNVIKDEIVHGDLPLQVGLRFEDYSDLSRDGFVSFTCNEEYFNNYLKQNVGYGKYGSSLSVGYSLYDGGTVSIEVYLTKPKKGIRAIYNDAKFSTDMLSQEIEIITNVDPNHPCLTIRKTNADANLEINVQNLFVSLSMALD